MGFNTNTTNRLPAITPIGTTYVFDITMLPAPASNVITLLPGNYIIADTVDFGLNSLKFDSVGEDLSIQTIDNRLSKITSSTTGTFIDIVNARDVTLMGLGITLSGAGATFCNVLGIAGSLDFNTVNATFSGGGTKTIGVVDIGNILFDRFVVTGFTDGITLQNITSLSWKNFFLQSDFTGSGAIINLDKALLAASISNGGITAAGGQSLFDIDPAISPINQVIIEKVLSNGPASYFKSGATGAITLFQNNSVSEAIDNVVSGTAIAGGGNYARFEVVGPLLSVGQKVTNTGFVTQTTYNKTGLITATNVTDWYEFDDEVTGLPVAFVADEPAAGTLTSDSVTVTSTAHGQSNGQTLAIINTIAYNAGYTIYNALTNTFDVNAVFVTGETTGDWDTGSLDETNKFLSVSDAGAQKDSKNIGSIVVNSNAAETVIGATSTFVDLNLGANAVKGGNIERWTLTNPTTGELRYDGVQPFSGLLVASISALGAGGTSEYHFRAVVNGSPAAPAPETALDIGNSLASASLVCPAEVVNGDLVKLQVENIDNTSNITITLLTVNIE